MAEYKQIGTIEIVTDTESPVWKMGEMHIGIDDQVLESYIRSYGPEMMYEQIAILSGRVVRTAQKINAEKQQAYVAVSM